VHRGRQAMRDGDGLLYNIMRKLIGEGRMHLWEIERPGVFAGLGLGSLRPGPAV